MGPTIRAVKTSDQMPSSTTVAIIGGGMVGLSAALTLAERNVPVVLIEKGKIGCEQSSRNLGWIRKTSRLAEDIPLALAADKLWANLNHRTGYEVGYRQAGIMFIARDEKLMSSYQQWLDSVNDFSLGSRILSNGQILEMVPGGVTGWAGGVYTSSDGRAEPTLASSAVAQAALNKGVIIIENCAVRTLSKSAGKVCGVVTERGEIKCEEVILAGGLWSRRFLGNSGVILPTLPVIASVLRTKPMNGPTEIAVGAPDFSFRKHIDGGYIITQRGALDAPLTFDHLKIGTKFLSQLRTSRNNLRIKLNKFLIEDLKLPRSWEKNEKSPFELVRVMDPKVNEDLNNEAMRNLTEAWPEFQKAEIEQSWAGMIDVTPDSNPVISSVDSIPGLTIATGFSGHGFGTSPAAGHLAADIVTGEKPLVDPSPYRFNRF